MNRFITRTHSTAKKLQFSFSHYYPLNFPVKQFLQRIHFPLLVCSGTSFSKPPTLLKCPQAKHSYTSCCLCIWTWTLISWLRVTVVTASVMIVCLWFKSRPLQFKISKRQSLKRKMWVQNLLSPPPHNNSFTWHQLGLLVFSCPTKNKHKVEK